MPPTRGGIACVMVSSVEVVVGLGCVKDAVFFVEVSPKMWERESDASKREKGKEQQERPDNNSPQSI